MEFSWSPHRVLMESMETPWGLYKASADSVRTPWGLCGLCENSMRTPWGLCEDCEDSTRTPWKLVGDCKIQQQQHLCVLWKGLVYVDHAIMFGLSSSAGVFGSIADMLIAIYKEAGFTAILKWVDDFFVIHLPDQTWTEQEFMDLTGYCGVPWSIKKMRPIASI